MPWKTIKLSEALQENVDEAVLTDRAAAIENCYITEVGSLARFPRLTEFADIPGQKPVFVKKYKKGLHAVSGGSTYRVSMAAAVEDLTHFAVAGGRRVIFADTGNELLMAAGGPIVRLRSNETERLSKDAPESTHVAYIDGYAVAIEPLSGRFYHADVDQVDVWNPLSVFAAEGKPDDLVAAIVTEHNELLLAGEASIEQFEPTISGSSPFFRRWDLGNGVLAPYTFLSADNRVWGVNEDAQWVAYSSQTGNIASRDIQQTLSNITDWEDAWAGELLLNGQYFIILQIPYATNKYGTEGITLLYDYAKDRWSSLSIFDKNENVPKRWPIWSVAQVEGRIFLGGEGKIYELGGTAAGVFDQRMLWRSGHWSRDGQMPFKIEQIILRAKRGVGSNTGVAPIISMRRNKNNQGFGPWVHRSLGLEGDRHMTIRFPNAGICDSAQFEIRVTDAADVQIQKLQMQITELTK